MDIRDRSVQAMVLHSRDYKEQDKLLTIVTPERGPERVIARGAKKVTGSLRPISQAFTRSQLVLSPAKGGVSFIREGAPEESYLPPGTDLPTFAYAAYAAELLLTAWPEAEAAPELYALTLTTFSLFKLDGQPSRTARWFELRLLATLGWLPPLAGCADCGVDLRDRRFILSPQRGQLLCAACGQGEAAPQFSAGAGQTLRRLLSIPPAKLPTLRLSAEQNDELEAAVGHYLSYHLESVPQARRVLRQLLGDES